MDVCALAQSYTPTGKSQAILDRAWEHVAGVPYQVTARWLFYRLLQEGYYQAKGDYKNKFLKLLATARKSFYGPWRPDTLADDTRSSIVRGDGFHTREDWKAAAVAGMSCSLHRWEGQAQYVELWFEAAAMISQFQHYTHDIVLRPFHGDPSLDYKWRMAKGLERASDRYDLPIVVFYFGDLDPKGEMIPESALVDIRAWCDVSFEFVRAALNPGDEIRYKIPENFDKPGTYQWEALDDQAAGELITGVIDASIDHEKMQERADLEADTSRQVRLYLRELEFD